METTMTATRIDRGSTETTTIYSEGGDLVFERTFDAPRERVWKAFMDPEIVPRWWGPHGTTTTVAEMDVRPGGKWRYVSRAPDREDVAFYGEYLEIEPPERFAWTFMFDVEGLGPQGGPETHTFEDLGGGRRSGRSGTSDRPRPSRVPWRPAWPPAPSRPGTASRPCSGDLIRDTAREPGTVDDGVRFRCPVDRARSCAQRQEGGGKRRRPAQTRPCSRKPVDHPLVTM